MRMKTDWRGWLDTAATVGMIAASGAFILAILTNRPSPAADPSATVPGAELAKTDRKTGGTALPAEPLPLLKGAMVGDDSARAIVIVFSDFECRFCGRFAHDTLPAFISKFVQSREVRFIFRHFPLESIHRQARGAAEAAECARRQGRFWQMHDALFSVPMRLTPSDIQKHARTVGLDLVNFGRCTSGEAAATIQTDIEDATNLQVTGTPTFFFGIHEKGDLIRVVRRQSGAIPLSAFEKLVADLLRQAAPR